MDLADYRARYRFATAPLARLQRTVTPDHGVRQQGHLDSLWLTLLPAMILRRLEEIKESLRVNEDDYRVERLIDRDTYLKTRSKLETQRREVDTKINAASGQRFLTNVPRDPEELRAMYESGNHEWRRAFIESLVEEIVIGPGVRGLNKFDPSRVKVKYRA